MALDLRRASPAGFARHASGGAWKAAPHLLLLNRVLMAAAAGEKWASRVIIQMPPRHGKALALDTPLPTPTGWTTMGDVQPGDYLLDEHGHPTRVVGVSPIWENRPCYTVRSNDGEAIVADAEHEWVARLDRRAQYRVHTSRTLARARSKRAQVAVAQPLDLPAADLLVDPYVLGVWLGDGATLQATFAAHDDDAPWTRAEIERRGYVTRDRATYATFGVSGLKVQLRTLGVLGNKHVPAAYLRGSIQQRRDLLAGLIDTDGHVAPDGQVEFCTTLPALRDAVLELVTSLGRKASVLTGRATLNGRDCGPKYRVMFYMAGAAYMPRKAARCRDAANAGVHYVDAVEAPRQATRCVEVDSPSHLFLAGRRMIPTHNSEFVSGYFPAWFMGMHPDRKVILTSFGDDLAQGWGQRNRDLLQEHGQNLFGVKVRQDTAAKGRWTLNRRRGAMTSTGMGGTITGRGGNLLIIDDPVKNAEEALSPTYRERNRNWYKSTLRTRLEEPGAIVVIQTRWHQEDLAGWLQADAAEPWLVISLPAIAEHDEELYLPDDPTTPAWTRKAGEPLWPALWPLEALEATRDALGGPEGHWWLALYQQRPTALGGGILKPEQARRYTRVDGGYLLDTPAGPRLVASNGLHRFGTMDLAASVKTQADFTVVTVFGIDGPDILVLDVLRGKWEGPDLPRVAARVWQVYGLAYLGVEQAGFQLATVQDIRRGDRHQDPPRPPIPVKALEPRGDKVARALALAAVLGGGHWYLPAADTAPWLAQAEAEMAAFPRGDHDDVVDTWSYGALERSGWDDATVRGA